MHEGAFLNSLRALHAGGGPVTAVMSALGAVALAAWVGWFFLADITLYEPSQQAWLEVRGAEQPVESAVEGQVAEVHLQLGREVRKGEVLVELDSTELRHQLDEARALLASQEARAEALRAELSVTRQAAQEHLQMSRLASDMARAENERAELLAKQAEEELQRVSSLQSSGFAAEAESSRALLEARQTRASADSRKLALERAGLEVQAQANDLQGKLLPLSRDLARLEGEQQIQRATLERLEYLLSRYQLRALQDGTLGEIATLRPGQTVRAGEKVASIVPSGQLRVVAGFSPPTALGRVRVGQHARVHLDGFPWTQYGELAVTVSAVASQIRDGLLRVELELDPDEGSRLPRQHGLSGTVEVEVERISPAVLVLRTLGVMLEGPRAAPVNVQMGRVE